MTSALDITRSVNPPRAAFLDFPLGHTAGIIHQKDLQEAIISEALRGFEELTEPGQVKFLPFEWPHGDEWKTPSPAEQSRDNRKPRLDTPQYQSEEDRLKAAQASGEEQHCALCSGFEPHAQ